MTLKDSTNTPDEAQLMRRLAAGDRGALGVLVERHQRGVVALAYRVTGDWATAEDVGQEAFLRVWRAAAGYRPTARFGTFLHRIVVNLCLDAGKKRKPTPGLPADAISDRAASPTAALESSERARAVRRVVGQLPVRQRVAVVLHRFQGLTVRELSDVTGWSQSAVESLLVRAYAALRSKLENP